jgi:phage baseplate assembly protein W
MMASITPLDKFYAKGLVLPFRRDQNKDFANSAGKDVFKSNLEIILITTCASKNTQGEVPFNQNLGSLVERLKHRNLDDETTRELAIYYIVDALTRNEPSIVLKSVDIYKNRKTFTMFLRIVYDIIDIGSRQIIRSGEKYEVGL